MHAECLAVADYTWQLRVLFAIAGACTLLILKQAVEAIVGRSWESFKLTDKAVVEGETRQSFPGTVATSIIATVYHAILSPLSAYTAYQFLQYDATQGVYLTTRSPLEVCKLYGRMDLIGPAFTAYALFMSVGLFLGWEKGLVAWFHHLIFTVVGLIMCYTYVNHELSAFAIAMEMSTVPLSVYHVLQRVEGHTDLRDRFMLMFGLSFLLCRPIGFSVGVYRSVSLWLTHPGLFSSPESPVPMVVFVVTHILFTVGLLLQYFWTVLIVKKAMKPKNKNA